MNPETSNRPGIVCLVARFALLVALGTLAVGAVVGMVLTLVLGKIFGSDRMALDLLKSGVFDGLFWGSIWLPGTVLAASVWRSVEARRSSAPASSM